MKPTAADPYPELVDKMVRVLTILSRKAKSLQQMGDYNVATGMKLAQHEVQILCTTEFGITADEIRNAVSRLKGKQDAVG